MIRKATLQDARNIATVHVETGRVSCAGIVPEEHLHGLSVDRRRQRWRNQLSDPEAETYVAETEGRIVGWISFRKGLSVSAQMR